MQRCQRFACPATLGVALLAAALLMLGPAAEPGHAASCGVAGKPAYEIGDKAAAKATLCLINRVRAARGIKALRFNKDQKQAADGHNRVMLSKNCFSHLCPGERDLVGRVSATGYLPCSCTWGVAENLAWGAGTKGSPAAIVNAWMASPDHRVNILNPHYEEIGIAVDDGSPAGDGYAASTYTTDFGFKR